MKASARFVTAVVLILVAHQSFATLYLHDSFGAPVVVGDKLIFGDNFFDARRLLCIDRKTGTKQWEVTDRPRVLKPWLEADKRLIISSGSALKGCDVALGKLTALYDTGLEKCMSVRK